MVMEAPSFVRISRPKSGAGQDGMIKKSVQIVYLQQSKGGVEFCMGRRESHQFP
jgi:hypothetical protein